MGVSTRKRKWVSQPESDKRVSQPESVSGCLNPKAIRGCLSPKAVNGCLNPKAISGSLWDSGVVAVWGGCCLESVDPSEARVVGVIFSFGSPERLVKNFALTVQMGSVLGGQDARPLEAPISYAWAYQDFLDNALSALLFVRRARRLWTLLIGVP
ncbi:hypothetical protein CDL15_Pgr014161 [Punica granatum]|uniref:Uncharacterized protein n=1 Tax=Punica granatum TaxID=22663 RepID=A0A218XJF0_PUNGR|nr:hypothetical protein CDL15_Pgr014161 [Punica granatum]